MKRKCNYKMLLLLQGLLILIATFSGFGQAEKFGLTEKGSPKLQSYFSTLGKTLNNTLFSPYASEYAKIENIDTLKILNQIYGEIKIIKTDEQPKYISSYRYLCGDWTYFMSNSVRVYEIISIKDTLTNKVYIAILHNNPSTEIPLNFEGWQLTLFDKNFNLLSSYDFEKNNQLSAKLEGDMCYTDLRLVKGRIIVVITYTITGSGGFPEKGELYEFKINNEKLELLKSDRIKNGRLKSWMN